MLKLEERVARLEGRIVEYSHTLIAIRDLYTDLIRQIGELRVRMDGLETRMDRLETRMDRLETRMDGLDHKLDQRFAWLVGIQVTTLLAMIAAFVGLAQLISK